MKTTLTVILITLFSMNAWSAQVKRKNRALLVVAELVAQGSSQYQWLYQFLDTSSVALARAQMSPFYKRVYVLKGPSATRAGLLANINSKSGYSWVKALDMHLHVHGSSNRVWMRDGSISTPTLTNLIPNNRKSKLRSVYSTACYGRSHADDWVQAGFKTASGAIGVNANSPYEYPKFMLNFAIGKKFYKAIAAGDKPGPRATFDAAARAAGFSDANSKKVIRGSYSTKIGSFAN